MGYAWMKGRVPTKEVKQVEYPDFGDEETRLFNQLVQVRETEKSWLLKMRVRENLTSRWVTKEIWWPKSQCSFEAGTLEAPEWLIALKEDALGVVM